MSAGRDTDTETIVYVRLLDEGTDVWRPVRAIRFSDGSFQIAEPDGYDPELEAWEFPPRAKVRCTVKTFAGGEEGLIAVAYAE